MQDAKEEVRSRLNIEDVIGEYVELKRAGRNFKGLSPFTSEKTPSFVVSPDKQIWHDFSSNKGGDIFGFVMEVEGMEFRAAFEHLARKAGVDLSMYRSSGNQIIAQRKKKALEANRLAARFFQQALIKNQGALEYVFKQRQLSKETVQEFGIGYAPSGSFGLIGLLRKKGFSKKDLQDAGLTNRFEGDLFRGRMMVPLMDPSGQVIGFTGRIIIDEPNAPKYLNTPQTVLYDKSRHIFALSQAKETIRSSNFAVLVEGNLDAISSHQVGVKQVVATAGTAMTEHHLKALRRLTNDIRLCFDGDKAGLAATERAISIAASMEIDLSVISLGQTDAKDPDELIQQSVQAWQEVIAKPMPAVDWVLEQYKARTPLDTAAGKRKFTTDALGLVNKITDSVERDHYYRKIAAMTGASLDAINSKASMAAEQPTSLKQVKAQHADEMPNRHAIQQDDMLALAIITPQAKDVLAYMDRSLLMGEERQLLADWIVERSPQEINIVPEGLKSIENYVKIVQLRADTRYGDLSDNDRYQELTRLIRLLEDEQKKQTKDILVEKLRDAESVGDEAVAKQLREELNVLIKETQRARQ
ncbi:MAG TPA: DNA primase [Candidatus Saccharibacteria bacterium]|nr:DNA primase [Candidatus Saccharibacteria bacterium]HMR37973.1 DNA primase [Candidatus Saccharibacteria bacterium]